MLADYFRALRSYASFRGRARRREFWRFFLVDLLIFLGLEIVIAIFEVTLGERNPLSALLGFVTIAYLLATIVPSLAVAVRRLHDTGRSGWWILIGFVPLVGGIILIVLHALDSSPGANRWGPNPKGVSADDIGNVAVESAR